jgi:mRNA interferase RelE/StbE
MPYRILFKPAVQRQFRKLPRDIQRQLAPKIDALAEDPRPSGIKKLSRTRSLYRLRSGNFRIVYEIQDDVLLILIIKIGHRKDIYRNLT